MSTKPKKTRRVSRTKSFSLTSAPKMARADTKPTVRFVTPPCDLCSDVSVAMICAPKGCTCLANLYQRRCLQHVMRLADTDDFTIVEDYTVDKIFSLPETPDTTKLKYANKKAVEKHQSIRSMIRGSI